VSAILDFEFVTRDARMIDMAVMLARLIGKELASLDIQMLYQDFDERDLCAPV
jgi:Ser/Thr protein kinase RdoA (MazF antagonist)